MSEVFNPDEFKQELNRQGYIFDRESKDFPGAYFTSKSIYLRVKAKNKILDDIEQFGTDASFIDGHGHLRAVSTLCVDEKLYFCNSNSLENYKLLQMVPIEKIGELMTEDCTVNFYRQGKKRNNNALVQMSELRS